MSITRSKQGIFEKNVFGNVAIKNKIYFNLDYLVFVVKNKKFEEEFF